MHTEILRTVEHEKPDCVVLVGDLLDKFEKIHVKTLNRAIMLLKDITKVCDNVVLLIGNHDRPNNNVFLTDEHPFNAVKFWDNITIVDKVVTHKVTSRTDSSITGDIICVPYVPVGRFREALKTDGYDHPVENPDCEEKEWEALKSTVGVFAHQEFLGAKMGIIKSTHGDLWHPEAPFLCSGHVHDYDQLKPNLYYVGTPFQHGSTDSGRKSISLYEYKIGEDERWSMTEETRIDLKIPKKLHLKMTTQELIDFELVENATIIRIDVEIDEVEHRHLMRNPKVKALVAAGVKIKPFNTRVKLTKDDLGLIMPVKLAFSRRLYKAVSTSEKGVQTLFEDMFGVLNEDNAVEEKESKTFVKRKPRKVSPRIKVKRRIPVRR
jgi:DNA repair exonuclease SbcCD nuclease subunit